MNGEVGTIYLIHFREPFKHARHYIGWACDFERRCREHEKGEGSRLIQVLRQAGIEWDVAATWTGTRSDERKLHNRHGAGRFCPICRRQRDGEER